MINKRRLFLPALLVVTVMISCKKRNVTPLGTLSEQDAVELLVNAVLPDYNGMLAQANQSVVFASRPLACGMSIDTVCMASATYRNFPQAASYQLQWHGLADCASGDFQCSINGSISYDGAHFSSAVNLSATGMVLKSLPGDSLQTVQLSVQLDGSQAKKAIGAYGVKTQITSKSTGLSYSKSDHQLRSGNISLTLREVATGNVYSGVFICRSAHQGTLKMQTGASYSVNW